MQTVSFHFCSVYFSFIQRCQLTQQLPSIVNMTLIGGKFKLESSDNFGNYLAALGVGFVIRNLAAAEKPLIEVINDGEYFIIKTTTSLKTIELKFKLNEEFEEDRLDGKSVKSVVLQDGNKLVQTQTGSDKVVKIVREFTDTHLIVVSTVNDVTTTRVYRRI